MIVCMSDEEIAHIAMEPDWKFKPRKRAPGIGEGFTVQPR